MHRLLCYLILLITLVFPAITQAAQPDFTGWRGYYGGPVHLCDEEVYVEGFKVNTKQRRLLIIVDQKRRGTEYVWIWNRVGGKFIRVTPHIRGSGGNLDYNRREDILEGGFWNKACGDTGLIVLYPVRNNRYRSREYRKRQRQDFQRRLRNRERRYQHRRR